MVGVPARSISCLTCRRRKKKCDKTTPTCLTCKNSRIECDGYTDSFAWVNITAANPLHPQIRARQGCKDTQQQVKTRPEKKCASNGQHIILYNKPHSSPSGSESLDSARSASSDILLPVRLARSAQEQLFMGVFGARLLAAGTSIPSDAAMRFASMGWTKHIAPLYEKDPAVRYATLAISTAVLATVHGDKQLQVKGIQTYNRAVVDVAKGLRQPNWYKRDGLLAAARIMATFELLFMFKDGPEPLAWKGHNQGQQAIFLARGPASFATGPPHQLYSDARINLGKIMVSMGQRKRSPFATPAWDTIPWQKHPKTVKDELIDLMQEIPGLLEQVDKFKACANPRQRQQLQVVIMSHCSKVRSGLDVWAAARGEALHRFDFYTHREALEAPKNETEYAFQHMISTYYFTVGTISGIMSFFTSRQGKECIPQRPVGFYASCTAAVATNSSVLASMTSSGREYRGDDDIYLSPGRFPSSSTFTCSSSSSSCSSSSGQTTPLSEMTAATVSETERYLWEAAVCASREVHILPFFFQPDAGVAHSAAGLMSLAVVLRYYAHPSAFCIIGNEMDILQSICRLSIFGISIGQLLERILGGSIPLLTVKVGPQMSHGLGWL